MEERIRGEAVALAREIGEGESVTFEMRPLHLFRPGAEVRLAPKTGAAWRTACRKCACCIVL